MNSEPLQSVCVEPPLRPAGYTRGTLKNLRPRPVHIDDKVLSLAKFAIEDFNKKYGASLELKKVLSVLRNVVCGSMYTFLLDVTGPDDDYVSTEVWDNAVGPTKVVSFRLMKYTEDNLNFLAGISCSTSREDRLWTMDLKGKKEQAGKKRKKGKKK